MLRHGIALALLLVLLAGCAEVDGAAQQIEMGGYAAPAIVNLSPTPVPRIPSTVIPAAWSRYDQSMDECSPTFSLVVEEGIDKDFVDQAVKAVPDMYLCPARLIRIRNQAPVYRGSLEIFDLFGKRHAGYAEYDTRRIDVYAHGMNHTFFLTVLYHEIGHLYAEEQGLNRYATREEQELLAEHYRTEIEERLKDKRIHDLITT